uniref:Uncharacterized protein n=1 Tax=Anguilla anguilla TaxID=7936 RepID=A0A0E9SYL2_ANGAN
MRHKLSHFDCSHNLCHIAPQVAIEKFVFGVLHFELHKLY